LSGSDLHQLRNVGILGGTFDPVHHGHLIAAEWVRECLALDKVLLIPCFCPPHKSNGTVASPEERLEMLKLATRDDPGVDVSDLEIARGGVSYTIDTLECLRAQHFDTRFFLILGNDAFAELATWKDYPLLLRKTRFVIMLRAGFPLHEVVSRVPLGLAKAMAHAPYVAGPQTGVEALKRNAKYVTVRVPQIEISSSEVRMKVNQQRSIQYLVPESVLQYIRDRGLYRCEE